MSTFFCQACGSKNVAVRQNDPCATGIQKNTGHDRVVVQCDDCDKKSLFFVGPWKSW